MYARLGVIIWIALMTSNVNAQPSRMEEITQEIWKKQVKRFKARSITEIRSWGFKSIQFYDDYGNLTKVESDSIYGRIGSLVLLNYDTLSQLIEKKIFYSNGNVFRLISYSYNSKGQLIEKKSTDSRGFIEAIWTYEYDATGNKTKETQDSAVDGYSTTSFKYIGGRITTSRTSNDLGRKTKISYKYTNRGDLREETRIDYYPDKVKQTLIYSYNEAGMLGQLLAKMNGESWGTTIYQYSKNGLLENEVWKSIPEHETSTTVFTVGY